MFNKSSLFLGLLIFVSAGAMAQHIHPLDQVTTVGGIVYSKTHQPLSIQQGMNTWGQWIQAPFTVIDRNGTYVTTFSIAAPGGNPNDPGPEADLTFSDKANNNCWITTEFNPGAQQFYPAIQCSNPSMLNGSLGACKNIGTTYSSCNFYITGK